jgi:hypothetical protein
MVPMPGRPAGRPRLIAAGGLLLVGLAAACSSSNPAAPTPPIQSTNFTGTLPSGGSDFKTFAITYSLGPTDLSVTVNSLATVDGAPVTGVPVGVGFGGVSGTTCVMQIFTPEATIGQEMFVPNGAGPGAYCVQIFDCIPGAEECEPRLAEPVTYSMTIRHF